MSVVHLLKGPRRGKCKTCRGPGTTRLVQEQTGAAKNYPKTHLLCERHAAVTAERLQAQGATVHRRWSGF